MQSPFVARKSLDRLRSPKAMAIAIIAVGMAILLFDVLEDSAIDGGFTDIPFGVVWNALAGLVTNVTLTVSSWGYAGIFALMFLESSSMPIPSEVILPFSGYLVSLGRLNFWWVIGVSTIAGVAGSLIDYALAMKGIEVIANSKSGRLLFSKPRLETVKRWFEKYPIVTVFFSRLIPGFRTLASFPAGAIKMPVKSFTIYTLGGCLTWNILLTYLGVYVGSNWSHIAGFIEYLIVGLSLALMFGFFVYFARRRKRGHE